MYTHTRLGCLLAVVLLALPTVAPAQQAGELVLYRDIAFRGQSYTVRGPEGHIDLGWMVRSVKVTPGSAWIVCGRDQYQQPCSSYTHDDRSIQRMIASARPDDVSRQAVTLDGGAAGQSLRGIGAEFFTAPERNGGRVVACDPGSPACASDTAADDFCRTHGWNRAAYQRQETAGGQSFLADVLCTRN